ncbi:hypothetical protein XELAEV_18046712mg [Xenopus laevis]|uniref:Uncharacterized protein n=1 Tax=Xenopus laevis TaxID=8355 RepID=A0A974BU86_XENLA|nr:hypothetical protein XELAEV_18046712mg [Xenopus laevis]
MALKVKHICSELSYPAPGELQSHLKFRDWSSQQPSSSSSCRQFCRMRSCRELRSRCQITEDPEDDCCELPESASRVYGYLRAMMVLCVTGMSALQPNDSFKQET